MLSKSVQLLITLLLSFTGYCQETGKVIPTKIIRGTDSKEAQHFFDEGQTQFDQKNFTAAIASYRQAIIADTNFVDAYDNLGLSYRKLNKLDSAEYYYYTSFMKDTTNTTAVQNMAVVAELQNIPKKAELLYLMLSAMEPENPEGYFGQARMQYLGGNLADAYKNGQLAEKYYNKMSSPHIGDCYYILCIICYELKKIKEAKTYLKLAKAAGINPDSRLEQLLK